MSDSAKEKNFKTVGQRMKAWRKSMSFKLKDLSDKIKISQGSLSDIENNKCLPSAKTLTNLCLYTDLNICWLLTGFGSIVGQTPEKSTSASFYKEYMQLMQDKKLKELMDRMIRIYNHEEASKRANLAGFLTGADPGV